MATEALHLRLHAPSQIDGQRKIKLACQIRLSLHYCYIEIILCTDEGLNCDTPVQEIDLLRRYPTVQHYLSLSSCIVR